MSTKDEEESRVPFLHCGTLNNLEGPFRWGKIAYKSSSRFDAKLSVSTNNNNKIIMYVEEVCVDGFKSYAQRTIVPQFDQYFNAITGLNGSGKSNILDSICFVLGITNLSQVRRRPSFCRRLLRRRLCVVVVVLFSSSSTRGFCRNDENRMMPNIIVVVIERNDFMHWK